MKSIFEEAAYQELKTRLNTIDENSKAVWGKMSPAQMTWHCQAPINIQLGKDHYNMKPNWFVKVLFKKSMYNDKPWKKGLPTAKVLKATNQKDFNAEKTKLEALIDETFAQKDKGEWEPHPAFGYFTAEQWGKMQYKHLDHHFRQFGV